MEITDATKAIMDHLDGDTAFDKTSLNDISSTMNGAWNDIASQQDSLVGSFSSIHGSFGDLENTSLMTAEHVAALPSSISSGAKTALIGRPLGLLTNLEGHMSEQFKSLTENLSLYSTHQSVKNALGTSAGCGSLVDHFGTLMHIGQDASAAVKGMKSSIDQIKQIKTQIQSEIHSFDTNVVGLLTGTVNNTILAQVVKGSGLHDQIDNILVHSGLATNGSVAQNIRQEVGKLLTPNLTNFFNKKGAMNSAVSAFNAKKIGILGQVGKELSMFNDATTTLKKLGAANALQSLFKFNECAQTLLGFVGSSGLISKLGV